ncbi:hypothetical protein GWO43_03145 [candidate division KSB1 bacterium]|nr:hypothetical protein [candidate division KSB1 bacterium]NIR70054.1 hypothetical protein [candidate division KSB1 bacterium]NIS23048.1 hypothetical protein [candidate division KSB1 bacterium]NIT69901.1 hypothetical protein [candidate division KSB1 bacterium]NIU23566.1 hypothetical protein [candidate division KSB1 bacterium]
MTLIDLLNSWTDWQIDTKQYPRYRMSHHQASRKTGFFFIVSWLLARLWWSLEISRLTIFRIKPRAVINRITQNQRKLPPCHWVVDRNRLYCISLNEGSDEMLVTETPSIERN